jgi:predicted nucleic acid-binding Zn finger protein
MLVAAIEIESRSEDQVRAWVRTKDAEHHVRFGPNPACTCPWFSKHGLRRGPCKHMLAVEMRVEDDARN